MVKRFRRAYDDESEEERIQEAKRPKANRNVEVDDEDEEIDAKAVFRIKGMENAPRKRSAVFMIEIHPRNFVPELTKKFIYDAIIAFRRAIKIVVAQEKTALTTHSPAHRFRIFVMFDEKIDDSDEMGGKYSTHELYKLLRSFLDQLHVHHLFRNMLKSSLIR